LLIVGEMGQLIFQQIFENETGCEKQSERHRETEKEKETQIDRD